MIKEKACSKCGKVSNDVSQVKHIRGFLYMNDWDIETPSIKRIDVCNECYSKIFDIAGSSFTTAIPENEPQGLTICIPCKIGDTIYVIPNETSYKFNLLYHPEDNKIYDQVVKEINILPSYRYMIISHNGLGDVVSDLYNVSWFLSREAAEQALTKLKEG